MKCGEVISMYGKSQSSLLVLVAIAIIVILIFVFSQFMNEASQSRILGSEKFTKLGKYLDIIKGISRTSTIFSAQRATQVIAARTDTYYQNSENVPTLKQIRYELSKEALKNLNNYIKNILFKETTVDYSVNKYTCFDYAVDENGLNSGQYDEKFPVGSYGSSISIESQNGSVSSKNNIYETITRDRFFFLYRKISEWVKDSRLFEDSRSCTKEICDTSGSCPGGCLDVLLSGKTNELENTINDPYVSCRYEIKCCYAELVKVSTEVEPGYPGECRIWQETTNCKNCYNCERHDATCTNSLSFSSFDSENSNYLQEDTKGKTLYFNGMPPAVYDQARMSIEVVFTCTDEKYQLSIPPINNRNLVYSFHTNVYQKCDCRVK